MTSIRTQIDAHVPIIAQALPDREGFVQIEHADYEELCDIAKVGARIGIKVYAHDDTHVVLKAEDFDALVHAAHDALHPPQESSGDLLNEIFGENAAAAAKELGINTLPEVPEDDANYRSAAMAYAVAIVSTKIQASSGLDFDLTHETVVDQAKAILAFLKG